MTDRSRNLAAKFGRAAKLASIPLLLAGLAACATPFKADVSRFQSQLPAPTGQTFAVVADDPKLAGGLEFALYADEVEEEMTRLGYTESTPEAANLLVRFDYGVDEGRERVRSTGSGYGYGRYDPFYGPWYGYSPRSFYRSRLGYGRAWGYGYYDPFFDRGPEITSYTVYTSGIDVKIDSTADGKRLFEGKAEAMSTSNRLQYLVPNLVEAMFTDFPGSSGETVRISIAPEKTTVRRID